MGRTAPDWPRMMRRATAASYCDLTSAEFEREVAAGRLPAPIMLGSNEHWSRAAIDEHLDRLLGIGGGNWRERSKLYGDKAA